MKKVILALVLAGAVGGVNAGTNVQDSQDLADCAVFAESVAATYTKHQADKDAIRKERMLLTSRVNVMVKKNPTYDTDRLYRYVNDILEVARIFPPSTPISVVVDRSQVFCFMTDLMK